MVARIKSFGVSGHAILPGSRVLAAVCLVFFAPIFLAAAVLITPGVLTDIFGFLCLIPLSRRWIKALVWRWLRRAAQQGRVRVSVSIRAQGSRPARPQSPRDPRLRRPPDRLEP